MIGGKWNGRYISRLAYLVGVHNGVGHRIQITNSIKHEGEADTAKQYEYDEMGNTHDPNFDLMTAFDSGASQVKLKVTGCAECERENG